MNLPRALGARNTGDGDGATVIELLSPLLYPDEAPAIPGIMRQCPLCRELMDGEDWLRLPRHETAGRFGKTIKLTCPTCHRQSSSIQWREQRQREAAL